MSELQLTKKERKAQQFRKSKEERDAEKQHKQESKQDSKDSKDSKDSDAKGKKRSADSIDTQPEEPKKKRKTRRGKKGKGANGDKPAGPRYILFVGNLPYDVKEEELTKHFATAKPSRIRIRKDRGIAFIEFDNQTTVSEDAKKNEKKEKKIHMRMELALKLHHSTLRNRTINVELTAGGGGNSEARVTKLKEKNEKLLEEMKVRNAKLEKKRAAKKAEDQPSAKTESASTDSTPAPAVHPARAALMR